MSTPSNRVLSPFQPVVTTSDFDDDEGKAVFVQATGIYEIASNNSFANGIIASVDKTGATGRATAYMGHDPVYAKAGGAFDEGAKLTVSSGKLVSTTTAGHIVVAMALEASSADGADVKVQPMFPGVLYSALA